MIKNEVTIKEYLDGHGVELDPASVDDCARLRIVVPELPGWDRAPETMFPGAAMVLLAHAHIVEGFVPNAVILVGKLSRFVDADDLLAHGFEDSRALPEWTEIRHDRERASGLPSLLIGGRYRCGDRLLVAQTRYISVHHIAYQYLIQVTVTVAASQWDRLKTEIGIITDGVRIG